VLIRIVIERLIRGTLEIGDGPYSNPWMLLRKKGVGKYRLINNAQLLNGVSLRDANLPPAADEFSERFAGRPIYSMFDLFSGHRSTNQISSDALASFSTQLPSLADALPSAAASMINEITQSNI
jgi:hypothetical protein